ncbi:hypothetical protein BGZ70_009315 [Mortierella alpina]|uniref:EF-hand domain-containing protein n=1 Tax=Mortierella alpina TaxID=64518 RepID=A0A9P6M0H1_MORAP|nr:hypothetical protein BGZ70_009315 [Mortierella alpina]
MVLGKFNEDDLGDFKDKFNEDDLGDFKDKFSEDDLRDFKDLFKEYDKDSDGRLTTAELIDLFNSLGVKGLQDDVEVAIKSVDSDNDGALDWKGFLSLMIRLRDISMNQHNGAQERHSNAEADYIIPEDELRELELAFKNCDKNKDGRITIMELINVFVELDKNISRDEADKAIKDFDADKDRGLNFQELCSLWKKMHSKKKEA